MRESPAVRASETVGDQIGHRLSGTNLERAADHNQRITLHAIRVNHSLTRIDLARITGLTAPAIANITRRLMDEELILGAGRRHGGRGQPPTKLVINPTARSSIGVNIDRDHITIVVVNFIGETLARVSREIQFALPGDVVAFWQESIGPLIERAGVDRDRIVGIGIAIPDDLARVDLPGRPDAYVQWATADLAALFSSPLDLPVFIENDAAAAAMGEQQLGLGQQYPTFFYILISSALGGGLVVEGTYFRGANGRSGELGFMVSDGASGPTDQIQNYVSLSGLGRLLQAEGLSVLDLLGKAPLTGRIAAIVERWIEDATDRLLAPTVAINCLINPAAVLIGGRLPAAHVDRLATRLNARLADEATNIPYCAPVARAFLSEDAPAVGAAILPFSHFLLPKSSALWKSEAPENALK